MQRLESAGCGTIGVLCTGEFPRLSESALMIYPDRVVGHVVEAHLPDGMPGVLMLRERQGAGMRSTATGVSSPYSTADRIADEVRRLFEQGADAIVLDCMGYDRKMLANARAATSVPVILSNGIVGSVLSEVVGPSVDIRDQVE